MLIQSVGMTKKKNRECYQLTANNWIDLWSQTQNAFKFQFLVHVETIERI